VARSTFASIPRRTGVPFLCVPSEPIPRRFSARVTPVRPLRISVAGLLRASAPIASCLGSISSTGRPSEIVSKGRFGLGDGVEGPLEITLAITTEKEAFPVFTVERFTMRPKPSIIDLQASPDERRCSAQR